MGSIDVVVNLIVAIGIVAFTAASARKAGAGSSMVWVGGILATFGALMAAARVLISFYGYGNWRIPYAVWPILIIVVAVLQWVFLFVGVAVLIRGAVKAARGSTPPGYAQMPPVGPTTFIAPSQPPAPSAYPLAPPPPPAATGGPGQPTAY